jgi:hypothetical protein
MLSSIIRNFENLRYAIGIVMIFNSYPVVFFVRDTLHIGPANSVFTAVFWGLCFLLMMPRQFFKRLYKPNGNLFAFGIGFLGVCICHYFTFNTGGEGMVTEFANYAFIFCYLLLLMHVPNDVKEYLVPTLFVSSLILNFTLIYSLIIDPNWTIGMRAAVTFANGGAQAGGNPHTSARNAIICVIAAGILIWKYKNSSLIKWVCYASIVFSVIIIVLAQAKACLLSLILIATFYFFSNYNLTRIAKSVIDFFSLRTLAITIALLVFVNWLLSKFYDIYTIILNYSDVLERRLYNVFFTVSGVQLTEDTELDPSSANRVSGFAQFKDALEHPQLFLVGTGYKKAFMDVPFLEAIINHGLLGLIFFDGFLLLLLYFSIWEIRKNRNAINLFLAYFFIYTMPYMASGGRPYDIQYWYAFIFTIRFLGIRFLQDEKPIQQQQQVLETV